MKRILAIILLLHFFLCLDAAEISPKGFVDTLHSIQVKDEGDIQNSKNRGRLGLEATEGDGLLFASVDAIYNAVISSQTGLYLHEAYGEYTSEYWDIRIGRQIITWGKADGIRITDLICPTDLTEFITLEFDDMRIPVNAFKFRLLFDKVNLEFIGIPVFTPGKSSPSDSPWHISLPIAEDINVTNPVEPDLNYKSVEGAAKLSLFLSGIDLAFSALYLWDDFPLAKIGENSENETELGFSYYRMTVFGAEAAIPAGDFVLRTEAAFYLNRSFQSDDFMSIHKKNMINWLAGIDWYPGNNWTIMVQFSGSSIFNYNSDIYDRQHEWIGTLNIQKKFLRETLTVSNMLYVGFNDPDFMERFSIEYALTDEFHISAGVDLYFGDQGTFGQYKDNSQAWIRAKYSF